MTGPVVPSDEDELREKLIDTLCAFDEETGAGIPPEELADALLPVVLADRERYADQRAAEELRATADEYGLAPSGKPWLPQAYMRARAAALAPENAGPE